MAQILLEVEIPILQKVELGLVTSHTYLISDLLYKPLTEVGRDDELDIVVEWVFYGCYASLVLLIATC